jgi:4-diphosphocytidyl-2-C-methyl-D-erythritol kinase
MAVLEEPAPAKLNLDLLVTGRRADGYHELDSLVVFTVFGDRLTFEEGDDLALAIEGPFAGLLAAETDNLVLRAARRLAEAAGVPARARIRLDKQIPLAAGLGGGSADAAATLRGLARFWRLCPAPADLARIALGLGADVPVCLAGRPARMRGVGEQLETLADLPPLDLVLVNPRRPVPTGMVFRALGGRFSPVDDRLAEPDDLFGWLGSRRNDLETAARGIEPAVGDVLDALAHLPGCRLARMSGSGATCFGLFDGPEATAAGAGRLAGERPDWWVTATRTNAG